MMDHSNAPKGPVQLTTPVRFCDALPEAVDVAIIGGGVIGVFAGLYMARAGLKVVVCEKGRVAGEQSSRNWGWIRQTARDYAELPIMMEATRLWQEADQQVGGRTGFRRGGILYLANDEKKLKKQADWLEIAKQHQLDCRMIGPEEIATLVDQGSTGTSRKWIGGLYTPNDARAEAWQAVPAIAELAREDGLAIRENCAVRALDVSAGQINGIVTEHGYVACEQVVLAGGAWSALFAARHGVKLPQLSVKSTCCQTFPMAEVFAGNAADETFAFRRREDGGYNLAGGARHDLYIGPDAFRHFFKYLPVAAQHLPDTSFRLSAPAGFPDAWGTPRNWKDDEETPFERMRVLDPEPNHRQIENIRTRFASRFPHLGKPEIKHAWAGMIDTMPDIIPVVDRVAAISGLVIATGMSGHGFGIGPGFAKILADLVRGKTPGHDISRFRLSRFSDGSRLEPGPSI